jgi:hypothetical protein
MRGRAGIAHLAMHPANVEVRVLAGLDAPLHERVGALLFDHSLSSRRLVAYPRGAPVPRGGVPGYWAPEQVPEGALPGVEAPGGGGGGAALACWCGPRPRTLPRRAPAPRRRADAGACAGSAIALLSFAGGSLTSWKAAGASAPARREGARAHGGAHHGVHDNDHTRFHDNYHTRSHVIVVMKHET